jgi:hypothetical protein
MCGVVVLPEFSNEILITLDVCSSERNSRVYPKASGLATWIENCKWYSSLPLGAVLSV